RRDRRTVLVDVDLLAQGREGSLRAVHPLAHAATRADRCAGIGLVEVETVGVDEAMRVPQFAAEADRERLRRLAVTRGATLDRARDPQIATTVGHLRDLRHDLAGIGEGLVDVPQRARATA